MLNSELHSRRVNVVLFISSVTDKQLKRNLPSERLRIRVKVIQVHAINA